MSRHARRTDSNHTLVVNALRMMGASVEVHNNGTEGAPDLVVGCFGVDAWVEVKPLVGETRRREPRASQLQWHERWRGRKPVVLRTIDDCAALIATLRGLATSCEVAS